jgi:hypothetical protein
MDSSFAKYDSREVSHFTEHLVKWTINQIRMYDNFILIKFTKIPSKRLDTGARVSLSVYLNIFKLQALIPLYTLSALAIFMRSLSQFCSFADYACTYSTQLRNFTDFLKIYPWCISSCRSNKLGLNLDSLSHQILSYQTKILKNCFTPSQLTFNSLSFLSVSPNLIIGLSPQFWQIRVASLQGLAKLSCKML